MNDKKFEQFIDELLLELPELSKAEDLNFTVLLNLKDRFNKTLKHDEENFLHIDKLKAREFLIFTFGVLCCAGSDRLEIESTFFYLANLIRDRRDLPIELSTEGIELQKQLDDGIEEQRREHYQEENDQFREFLSTGYDDDLDSDQQEERFW